MGVDPYAEFQAVLGAHLSVVGASLLHAREVDKATVAVDGRHDQRRVRRGHTSDG